MLSTNQFPIGSLISFEFKPVQALGTGLARVRVLAILDADTANAWIDPRSMHANVYPTLGVGVPNDYSAYSYLKLRTESGEITCVGIPWIKDESLVIHQSQTLQFTIKNAQLDDLTKIHEILSAAGYSVERTAILNS